MCKEDKFLRDENDLIIPVDEIIADAKERFLKIDRGNSTNSNQWIKEK